MELTGRTVVVTGGASGIGKALAERFAMEAAQAVVVADIDEAGAKAVADGVAGAAIGVGCDVTDEAAVNALIDWARQGPPQARVITLEVIEEEPRGERGFSVR